MRRAVRRRPYTGEEVFDRAFLTGEIDLAQLRRGTLDERTEPPMGRVRRTFEVINRVILTRLNRFADFVDELSLKAPGFKSESDRAWTAIGPATVHFSHSFHDGQDEPIFHYGVKVGHRHIVCVSHDEAYAVAAALNRYRARLT